MLFQSLGDLASCCHLTRLLAYHAIPEGVIVPIIGLVSHHFHFLLLPRLVLNLSSSSLCLAFQDLCPLFQGSQHTLTSERHCLSSDVERKRMMILLVLETLVVK